MLFGFICFVFAIVGIIGFYNDSYILTYIGFGFCFLENILGRITDNSKTMQFFWFGCLIGWIIVKDFWLGISIGACFEGAIAFIGGVIIIFLGLKFLPDKDETKDLNNHNEENVADILEETKNKAKQDLATGVKKEELDEMLKNGYITEDVYNETLDSIKALEMLANLNIDELKNNNEESTKN